MLCDYGCGKEAIHQFKNGKWCCSKTSNSCESFKNNSKRIELIKKNHKGMKGKHHTEISNFKNSLKHLGRKHSKDTKEKMKTNHKGNTGRHFSEKHKEKLRKNRQGKTYNEIFSEEKGNEIREKSRIRLLNGGAIKMIKAIKSISKDEMKLREMVKQIYPDCEFQYPIFNYSLDVALPDKKIAIEFDGYYHFNCKKNIDYHTNRRNKIINEGWKFLRYTMFDKFPSLDQIKNDINRLL